MTPIDWNVVETPGAAFVAGVLGVIFLIARGSHRVRGVVMPEKIAAAAMLCFAIYTLVVLMVPQFFGLAALSTLIQKIGNDRVAILFMGITADLCGRYYRLF
jgi:hypothetical protein